jgi:3-oxoacyl-[acyl-carrier protein] reductase
MTAMITGAGRHIGRRIALLFAAEGAAVGIVDKCAEAGRAAEEEIIANGGRATFAEADIRDPESVSRAVGAVGDIFGGIDILVNNAAAVGPPSILQPFLDIDFAEGWKTMIDTNLSGTFIVSQIVARTMAERKKGGVIINISSIQGSFATRNCTAYGVSKAGINQLTAYMAAELETHNIRVNAIAPGTIPSEERLDALKQVTDPGTAGILGDRWGKPEDVARSALFLAGEGAGFINGQVIGVDGGASVRFRRMDWLRDL